VISSYRGPSPALREDFRNLANGGRDRLGASVLSRSRPYRRAAEALLAQIEKSHGYPEVRSALDEAEAYASQLTEFVADLKGDLSRRQEKRSTAEPFGYAWRDKATAEVAASAGEKATQATQTWIGYYAEAFAARRFDICVWLSGTVPLPAGQALSRRMLRAARAAEVGNTAASLPALETLTDSGYADRLPAELRYRLWCMRVRVVARGSGDPAQARDLARGTLARAGSSDPALPADVVAALHTALGECLLASDDAGRAAQEMSIAVSLAPGEPAGYVLRGLAAESAGDFAKADDIYDAAIDVGGARAVAEELFAPAPPNLLWRYGRRICVTEPESAVRAIRRALGSGIRGADEYPERRAYEDLAKALEQQKAQSASSTAIPADIDRETAEAYWEAGRRHAWAGDEAKAQSYMSKASRLDPGKALYAFELAETLRMRAINDDGTVSQDLLAKATETWDHGYRLGIPEAGTSWAYVTMALIMHERSGDLYRPRGSWRAVALLERGLLSDPQDVRIMVQLSQAYRLLGHRRTALDLTSAAFRSAPHDNVVFDQHFLALRELGQDDEAIALLDKHERSADEPWQVNRKVQILITLGRTSEAADLLQSVPPGDLMLYYLQLGLCQELEGQADEARQSYERACGQDSDTTPKVRSDLSAWACYLVERYDEAVEAYSAIVEDDPEEASLRCDFGQMLLARGDRGKDDVRRGKQHFLVGIETTCSMVALVFLERIELPRLRKRVIRQADHGDITATLDEISSALGDRRAFLDRAGTARDELQEIIAADDADARQALQLGWARMALADGNAEEALDSYVKLAEDAVPEARNGVSRAAGQIRTISARLAQSGDLAGALANYDRLFTLLGRVTDPSAELTATTHLQAALTALDLGRSTEFAEHLRLAFASTPTGGRLPSILETVAELHDRPLLYWKVVDATRSLQEGTDGDRVTVNAAGRLLDMLSPTLLLRAGREDVGAAQLSSLVAPLTIRLGAGLLTADQQGSPQLLASLKQMRKEVKHSTGVKIPRVDVRPMPPGSDAGRYEIELYETRLAGGEVPVNGHFVMDSPEQNRPDRGAATVNGLAGSADPLTAQSGHWSASPADPDPGSGGSWSAEQFVVRHLEALIRTHLPRLFSVDDVGLWLSSASTGTSDGADIDRLSRADGLEILRLLRLLLREQVPIVDCDGIFSVIQDAEPGWSALELLPKVRWELRSHLAPPAVLAAPALWLPPDLENALAAGLPSAGSASWELPRADVPPLTDRIVAWHEANASDGPIVVRDPALRAFFWRLIVGLVAGPIWVLTERELHGAR
jgi:tetratricopeptide (TPR) repeat protein